MSKQLVIITAVFIGLVGSGTALALDGSGTQEDPWRIKSLDDFNDFAADANYWAGFTRLETDVNLAGRVYERAVIGDRYYDGGWIGTAFSGVFDGNDHKIINLTIDGGTNDYLGLFGFIDDGEVRNLGLEGGSVIVSGMVVGGLVGATKEGTISNCYSTVDVNGGGSVGGLMGSASYHSISNCYSTGDVSGTGDAIGGLIGYALGGVSNCYSTGNVSGDYQVGGLVGNSNNTSISNCYSSGDVNGVGEVGGLMGIGTYTGVSNCYSTGDVSGTGDAIGGLVGYNYAFISCCFWDTDKQTHGVTESIGFNEGGIVTNVEGLPTSQLHQQSTFADWDFINIWNIGENQTYPYLRAYLPSDINKDGIVNFLDFAITANKWLEDARIEQLP
jgi:hypothetical protein